MSQCTKRKAPNPWREPDGGSRHHHLPGRAPLAHPEHNHVTGKLLLMSGFLEVEAEVNIQQELQAGGAAVVLNEEDTFPPSSVAVTWRGDGAFLATISQAADECAP